MMIDWKGVSLLIIAALVVVAAIYGVVG